MIMVIATLRNFIEHCIRGEASIGKPKPNKNRNSQLLCPIKIPVLFSSSEPNLSNNSAASQIRVLLYVPELISLNFSS